MKKGLLVLTVFLWAMSAFAEERNYNFDDIVAGELPQGWEIATTDPRGPLAEWQVIEDATAPSSPNVLSITKINDTYGGAFNLFWTREISFRDGLLEVKIKANRGEVDQGGGLIWRAQDVNNYYIARYNPLERNYRLYYVKDGARKILDDAKIRDIGTGDWFVLTIQHKEDKITGWLNRRELLHATDKTFTEEGGVGFWTKADAASSFDDFTSKVQN